MRTTQEPVEQKETEEPMQCDSSHLSQEERLYRLRNNLRLYCGNAGHHLRECRARPLRQKVPTPGKHVEYTQNTLN